MDYKQVLFFAISKYKQIKLYEGTVMKTYPGKGR